MTHTLKLDDMELTALITHLEGQSEMMVESRLNCSNPSEMPDREEVLLNLVYAKAFTIGWEADDEDDLIEEVTTATGWCIKNIDYEIQLK